MAVNFQRALMWPAITVVLSIAIAWVETKAIPETGMILTTANFVTWLTLVGAWGGWAMVKEGGTYWHAAVAGVALWILCGAVDIVLYGFGSGFGVDAVLPDAVGGSSIILFGALVGGGWAATKGM